MEREGDAVLSIRDLRVHFSTDRGLVRAVDGVDLSVRAGETMALVGESGSGKTVTALSIMKLVPVPPGRIVSGEIDFRGEDLLKMPLGKVREKRGRDIAMIFQEPASSLNPTITVGEQIMEAIRLHQGLRGRAALEKAIEMLNLVKIQNPEKRVREYPHQLSGGMKQRVMIAVGLSCRPKLLIADEPTASLDVTIQAQILHLMKELRHEVGTTTLLITHSLGIVAEMADRVSVMYAGRIVETAPVHDIFRDPLHPYTRGLVKSIVNMREERRRLDVIPGAPPNPARLPEGCRFNPRCEYADERCRREEPGYARVGDARWVRCWMTLEGGRRQ
ncbi:MAG: ABC transporter ATP-binding protein [Firmicutes bacterium]|jgi:oligopeptide/dipeptide ABC transporter ATP-binding protein|nr:ABC transporter ATP-binding protein [Bacillota bacterium]